MTVAAFFDNLPGVGSGLLSDLTGAVSRVESVLEEELDSRVETVREVGRLTFRAGGKRLRPALLAISARAAEGAIDQDRCARLGACLEMIHMATLIHDDVIDGATTRRGRPTAAAVHGNASAILSGDVLLAKAMAILARDGDLEIIRTVSQAVVEMAEGEVRELETRGDFELGEADHLQILRMKTAAFVESCCHVGAIVVGAPERSRRALAQFGHHVGLAFQIVDDLIDYTGDPAVTGKPRATDFREGCATLPLIFLREGLVGDEAHFARRKFGNGVTDDEVGMICGWMEARGAFARARQVARGHANDAIEALSDLPDGEARSMLAALADHMLRRDA